MFWFNYFLTNLIHFSPAEAHPSGPLFNIVYVYSFGLLCQKRTSLLWKELAGEKCFVMLVLGRQNASSLWLHGILISWQWKSECVWEIERVGEWESERVREWESERVGEWESGRVREWESERVNVPTCVSCMSEKEREMKNRERQKERKTEGWKRKRKRG